MLKAFSLALSAGLLAVAACNPSGPADPDPMTPPEQTGSASLPDLPGTDQQAGAGDGRMVLDNADNMALKRACQVASVDGLCNIEFGMSEAEARKAFPQKLYGDATENTSCFYLRPSETGYGRAFMMIDDKMQRIDVREAGVETLTGAQIGMTVAEVEDMYATTSRSPNKYAPGNDDLRADLGDGYYAIFESDNDGKIRAYRIGLEPAVSFVEGCA